MFDGFAKAIDGTIDIKYNDKQVMGLQEDEGVLGVSGFEP